MKKAVLVALIAAIAAGGLLFAKNKLQGETVNPDEILNNLEETNPEDFSGEGLNDLQEEVGSPKSDTDEINSELKSLEEDLNSINADDFSSSGLSEF